MQRLALHSTLALDMDRTLVDGKNSQHLRNFVHLNHRLKSFFIITFRGHDSSDVLRELRAQGLDPNAIKDVVYCPLDYSVVELKLASKRMTFIEIREEARKCGIRLDDIERLYQEYVEWKGKMAAHLGCTVLVDDMPEMVLPGCHKHGVQFINVDDLVIDPALIS
jgi:hypothetical protein